MSKDKPKTVSIADISEAHMRIAQSLIPRKRTVHNWEDIKTYPEGKNQRCVGHCLATCARDAEGKMIVFDRYGQKPKKEREEY